MQRFVVLLILAIALLRFINLGTKPYWSDEVYTSLRLSGYTKQEVFELSQGEPKSFDSVGRFQCVSRDRTLNDTLTGLIVDDVHPPLYFILSYYWAKLTGCSIGNLRLLSAAISLLILPIGYGLAYEIFKCRDTALFTTLLLAASPILLIYAQEARPYSLLTSLSLLSSLLLLRSQPGRAAPSPYLGYILTSTAGLYCHTLYYLTLIGQGLYCLWAVPKHPPAPWQQWRRNIICSLLLSWGLFVIWLMRVVSWQGMTISVGANYTWKAFAPSLLWQRIYLNLVSLLYDFYHPLKSKLLVHAQVDGSVWHLGWQSLVLGSLICLLLVYSLAYTYRHRTHGHPHLLAWLAVPSILLLIKDITLGGSAVTVIRYQLLTVSGLYICLAFSLISYYKQIRPRLLKQVVISLAVGLVQLQLYSNWTYLQAPTWWSKMGDYQIYQQAAMIQSPQPLIAIEANPKRMIKLLKLSHVFPKDTKFQLIPPEDFAKLSDGDWAVIPEK